MNDLEKLIYLHDPRGDAKTFLLTKEELQEFSNAAITVGQDDIDKKLDVAYTQGYDEARHIYEWSDEAPCAECGFHEAKICYSCFEE